MLMERDRKNELTHPPDLMVFFTVLNCSEVAH